MTLGQRIQELRKQSNLSQEALGEKLGVSRQAVSRWEMDGAVPEVDKLIAMGRLFEVDLNDLLQVAQPGPAGEEEGELPDPAPEEDGPLHPANWWKWLPPILALLALVLGLVALTLSFGRTTGKLGDRLTALESRVEELDPAGSIGSPGGRRLGEQPVVRVCPGHTGQHHHRLPDPRRAEGGPGAHPVLRAGFRRLFPGA